MTRPLRDISASVKQRLLNVAHERGEEFEQALGALWTVKQSRPLQRAPRSGASANATPAAQRIPLAAEYAGRSTPAAFRPTK
jgi:hypothetical protein